MRTVNMPETISKKWVEEYSKTIDLLSLPLYLDFNKTRSIDAVGVGYIVSLAQTCRENGSFAVLCNVAPGIYQTLQEHNYFLKNKDRDIDPVPSPKISIFKQSEIIIESLSLFVEILYWATIGSLKKRIVRLESIGEQMYLLGYKAIGIVVLLSFLIGIVLSTQAAIQLKQFGADIFIVAMITISMVREIGPLITAIILAGRSGSATTAEIATMQVQEEIDALRIMGINPVQFILVPKFIAITITMPLLSVFAVVAGICGGFTVSLMYLDISPHLFWTEFEENLLVNDFLAGFFKSIIFSWLIIWIGSIYGLRVRGGAAEVGLQTTTSVVTCIFVIIIADALFSFVLR